MKRAVSIVEFMAPGTVQPLSLPTEKGYPDFSTLL